MYKFLNRLWRQVYDLVGAAGEDTLYQAAGKKSAKELAEELNRERHRLVGKVVEDIERNNFNTAIAAIMELSNAVATTCAQLLLKSVRRMPSLQLSTANC